MRATERQAADALHEECVAGPAGDGSQLAEELMDVGRQHGWTGVVQILRAAWENGQVVTISRLDRRLLELQQLMTAAGGASML